MDQCPASPPAAYQTCVAACASGCPPPAMNGCTGGTLARCVRSCPTAPPHCGCAEYRDGARPSDDLLCRHDDQPGGPHMCYPLAAPSYPCDADWRLCDNANATRLRSGRLGGGPNWCQQTCFLDCPRAAVSASASAA